MSYAGVPVKLTCEYLKVAFNAVRGVSQQVSMVLAARAAYGILEAHALQLGHEGAGAARAAYPDVAPALVVLAVYVVEEAKTAGYDISPAALHEP